MTKEHILSEIKRMAKGNGGIAIGKEKFTTLTGIKASDWYGRYWAKWSDAVQEAGFTPNRMIQAYPENVLIEKFIALTRQLRRIPAGGDVRLKASTDKDFPSHSVFERLGTKKALLSKVVKYCEDQTGFEDILILCSGVPKTDEYQGDDGVAEHKVGYVYLLKHGSRREYKIGKTLNPLRREGEIGVQLPEKLEPIHYIMTDDPSGVELYWHARFRNKRREGEWFVLNPADIKSFKRWRSIY